MKKIALLSTLVLLLGGCATLSEMTALKKCEFRLHSLQQPALCGIDVSQKRTWTDFNFMEGQVILAQLLNKSLPLEITVNVEVRNPGTNLAAVNSIQWISFLDDLQLAEGAVEERVEVPPSGGVNTIPIRVRIDLIDYLEGENPRAMLNFALTMFNAGDRSSQISMKIKPTVLIGSRSIQYPDYFTITKEYKSGD